MAVDLDQARVDDVVAGFEGAGHVGVAADLRDLHGHAALVDARASTSSASVYVLANLAAVLRRQGSLDEVTEDDWDFQHDVNLKAAFFLCRAAGQRDDRRRARVAGSSCSAPRAGGPAGSAGRWSTPRRRAASPRCAAGWRGRSGRTGSRSTASSPGQVHTPMLMTGLAPEVYENDEEADAAGLRGGARGDGRPGRVPRVRPRPVHHRLRRSTCPAAS